MESGYTCAVDAEGGHLEVMKYARDNLPDAEVDVVCEISEHAIVYGLITLLWVGGGLPF